MKLIFIRGLIRNKFHWDRFPSALKARLPKSAFYFVDIPGNGAHYHEASPNNVEDMARHCQAILTQNKIQPPYHLVSLSLGGMVALKWLNLYEANIASVCVINSSASNIANWYERFNPKLIGSIIQFLSSRNNFRAKESAILNMTSSYHKHDYQLLNQWEELHQRFPTDLKNIFRQLLAGMKFTTPTINAEKPVLFITSDKDKLVSTRCSHSLAKHYNKPIKTHSTAGHDLPLDDPNWLAETITQWYQQKS